MTEKIRWGVLGVSKFGEKSTVPLLAKLPGSRLAAIASRDLAKAKASAEKHGAERAYGSYDELLADKSIDAVYIPLPIGLHAAWCIKCAQAGKPVLCEKPLAATEKEAREVVDAFASRNLLLVEGLMYRFHPMTQKFFSMLRDGAVGQPTLIRASFSASDTTEGNFRFKKELGGGALLDVGIYCVDFVRRAAGEEPNAIFGAASIGQQTGVDETIAGVMRFPSGAVGYFGCSLKSQFECSYEVVGTKGRLLVDKGALCAWPGGEFKIRWWQGDQEEEIAIPPANHYELMIQDFMDALRTGRSPGFPASEAPKNLRIVDALLKK